MENKIMFLVVALLGFWLLITPSGKELLRGFVVGGNSINTGIDPKSIEFDEEKEKITKDWEGDMITPDWGGDIG